MNAFFGFVLHLASMDTFINQARKARAGSMGAREMILALALGVLVGTAIFLWVYFRFRKKQARRDASDFARLTKTSRSSGSSDSGSSEGDGEGRRRRRRRRRPHRQRNPTLQETGGLPPPRGEDEPPKF
jgi:hypothetical protein